jgi:hypothetical protein
MKSLIAATIIGGIISIGFSLINRVTKDTKVAHFQLQEKIDLSHQQGEKRLASWD